MATQIRTGIIGGAGYTGGELLRLLLNHPNVQIEFVHSKSNAGQPVYKVHTDLLGSTEMVFADSISQDIDVLFLCLGHGESARFLKETPLQPEIKVIDLANDFRLKKDAITGGRRFIYGLPELNREDIRHAGNIANPGCFATAIQLGLLPLAAAGSLVEVYTTGITGSTGAGQSLSSTSHFSWRANNIQAYKTLTHQHLGEIHQSLQQLQAHDKADVSFVPWRGDFTRGIFISSTTKSNRPLQETVALYKEYYKTHPFTTISDQQIHLKQVVNTNKCLIHLEQEGNRLVIHSVIDNLLKGASGQAVQNMNIMAGLEETTGLLLKSTAF